MVNWNRLLDKEVVNLVRTKRFARKPGSDGEKLDLYLEGNGTRFKKGESPHLARLKSELNSGDYRPRPVFKRRVPKTGSGSRAVYSLASRDYLVSRAVTRALVERDEAFASKGAKEVVLNLVQHLKGDDGTRSTIGGFIRLDVRDYYDSIPEGRVTRALMERGLDRNEAGEPPRRLTPIAVLQMLGEAPVWKSSEQVNDQSSTYAPQGFPHSAAMAQWYLHHYFLSKKRAYSLSTRVKPAVFRYVDDILLLYPNSVSKWRLHCDFAWMKLRFRVLGLRIHPRPSKKEVKKSQPKTAKTMIVKCHQGRRESFKFLGLSLSISETGIGNVTVPEDVLKNRKTYIWRQFNRYFGEKRPASIKKFDRHHRIQLLRYRILRDSAGCRYKGKSRGFVNYWGLSDDASAFASLDRYVAKCCHEFGVVSNREPAISSDYTQSFRKIKAAKFNEIVKFNYDTMNDERRRRILHEEFGVSKTMLAPLSSGELNHLWHEILRGDLVDLPVGGYHFGRGTS